MPQFLSSHDHAGHLTGSQITITSLLPKAPASLHPGPHLLTCPPRPISPSSPRWQSWGSSLGFSSPSLPCSVPLSACELLSPSSTPYLTCPRRMVTAPSACHPFADGRMVDVFTRTTNPSRKGEDVCVLHSCQALASGDTILFENSSRYLF